MHNISWILCIYIIAAELWFVKDFFEKIPKKFHRKPDTQYLVVAASPKLNLCRFCYRFGNCGIGRESDIFDFCYESAGVCFHYIIADEHFAAKEEYVFRLVGCIGQNGIALWITLQIIFINDIGIVEKRVKIFAVRAETLAGVVVFGIVNHAERVEILIIFDYIAGF